MVQVLGTSCISAVVVLWLCVPFPRQTDDSGDYRRKVLSWIDSAIENAESGTRIGEVERLKRGKRRLQLAVQQGSNGPLVLFYHFGQERVGGPTLATFYWVDDNPNASSLEVILKTGGVIRLTFDAADHELNRELFKAGEAMTASFALRKDDMEIVVGCEDIADVRVNGVPNNE